MLKVKLIEHTPNPEKIISAAAKLCYSNSNIDTLLDNLTPDKIESFLNRLMSMGHCYDEDTEVLTSTGFKKWSEINNTTLLCTIDPKNRTFKGFEIPSRIITREVDEELVYFNSNHVDLLVTDGHKIYSSLSNSIQNRVNPTFDLYALNEMIKDKKPDYVYKKPMRMAKASINPNNEIKKEDLWYSLYGFFIGDGNARENSRNVLTFHLKLQRKIDYLTELCNDLDLTLEVHDNDSYFIRHDNITKDFREMFYNNNNEKTFPDSFFNISNNQFNLFMDGLKNSDGTIKRDTWCYYSTSKELIDKIQALGAINDTVFTIQKQQNNCYKMNCNSRILMPHLNDARANNYACKQYYKGKVYCATVSTGLLVVRRNNKVVLCGNCSPIEHVSFTFGIEGVSRSLTHQLVRHRIASYSQQSQRYVKLDQFEYVIPPEIEKDEELKKTFILAMKQSQKYYDILVDKLNARYLSQGMDVNTAIKKAIEDARYVFPNACCSKVMFTMNARTLINFFQHRCCTRAQWEIRQLANEMLKQVKEVCPILFKHAGPSCIYTGKCPEGSMTCGRMSREV